MAWTKAGNIKGATGPKGDTGATGANGTGVSIKGSVADMEALKIAHPTGEPGDAYILQDSGHMAVWDEEGSTWVDVGQIKGDTGATGPKGDTGAKGDKGADGTKVTLVSGTPTGGSVGDIAIDPTTGDIWQNE